MKNKFIRVNLLIIHDLILIYDYYLLFDSNNEKYIQRFILNI